MFFSFLLSIDTQISKNLHINSKKLKHLCEQVFLMTNIFFKKKPIKIFEIVTLLILVFGFLFGAILQSAKLNRFNVISGMATLEDFSVAKAIAVAIGIGAILINLEISFGVATYHVKPLLLGGIAIGGLIFGSGMAILGYCPGTLAVSIGEGSLDALVGVVGAIVGGIVLHPCTAESAGRAGARFWGKFQQTRYWETALCFLW
jgi:uncharacterized membrane protein YedE/YeeE